MGTVYRLDRGVEGQKFKVCLPPHLVDSHVLGTHIAATSTKVESTSSASMDNSDSEAFDPNDDHAPSPVRFGIGQEIGPVDVEPMTPKNRTKSISNLPASIHVANSQVLAIPITSMSTNTSASMDDSDPEEFDPDVDHTPSPIRFRSGGQEVSLDVKPEIANNHTDLGSPSFSDTCTILDSDDDETPSQRSRPIKRSRSSPEFDRNDHPSHRSRPVKRSHSHSSSEFDPDDDSPPSPVRMKSAITNIPSLEDVLMNDAIVTERHGARRSLCASPEPGVELSAYVRSMYALEIWQLRYNTQWFKHSRAHLLVNCPERLCHSVQPAKVEAKPLTFAYLTEILGGTKVQA